ncbi:hypothetical protein ACJX0J_010552 [Zea mays]
MAFIGTWSEIGINILSFTPEVLEILKTRSVSIAIHKPSGLNAFLHGEVLWFLKYQLYKLKLQLPPTLWHLVAVVLVDDYRVVSPTQQWHMFAGGYEQDQNRIDGYSAALFARLAQVFHDENSQTCFLSRCNWHGKQIHTVQLTNHILPRVIMYFMHFLAIDAFKLF